jgi:2-phospho-L-lactate guanylyltransferase
MIWAIVPSKTLERAKTRLASMLEPEERRALSLAMLRDVLTALLGTRTIDRVAVVTQDNEVACTAYTMGAGVLLDGGKGHNAALEEAIAHCQRKGASAVLIMSADLPLLRSATIEQIVARAIEHPAPRLAVLAPSREGTGTNAMLQRPPGVLPLRFGLNSLQLHQQVAEEQQVHVELAQAADLGLDIDTPADLLDFARIAAPGHTQAALTKMQLMERLLEHFYGTAPVL